MADTVLPGKWTYRSFYNRAALVNGNAQAALDLIFAEAVFTFALEGATGLNVRGTLDWQGGGASAGAGRLLSPA